MFNLFKRTKILSFKDLVFKEEEFSRKARIDLQTQNIGDETRKYLEHMLNHYSARINFSNGYFISVKFGTVFYSNGKDTYEVYSNLDREAFVELNSEQITEYMILIQNQ